MVTLNSVGFKGEIQGAVCIGPFAQFRDIGGRTKHARH